MRCPERMTPVPLTALALACVSLTCAFPTDESDAVQVVIQSPSLVVIRGQQLPLFARAFRVSGTDTLDVRNVVFEWRTGNASLATVQDDGGGYAHVTGVNSGTVEIIARAVAFEQADIGTLQVRVSNPLEVDSVRPSLVRFGDTITVYGVGVDSIFFAFLDNNVTLFDYPIPGLLPTRTRDSLGFSTATFWVTPPARSSRLTFFGPGVFGNAPDTTRVIPVDRFEPNETAAWPINLDAPPRFPALPQIKFYNPALAFEIPRRDEIGIEWYRFAQQTGPRDLTLILTSPEARGTFATFFTDSLSYDPADSSYRVGPQSWTLGPSSHFCGGIPFEPAELQPESTIVALGGMPAGALHTIAFYAQPARYGLAVIEGYVTSNPAVPRDAHEEDDFCDAADARGLAASVPTNRFRDTLTIDNPHDIDWIAFEVTAAGELVHFRLASLVPGDTLSDIDLYVLSDAAAGLVRQGSGEKFGSFEDFTLLLGQGRYYAVVVDFAGVAIPYTICFGAGTTCGGAFPVAPSATSARVSSPKLGDAPQPHHRLRPVARP